MYSKNVSDVEYPREEKHRGTRLDGRNLVQAWQAAKPPGKVTNPLWGLGDTPWNPAEPFLAAGTFWGAAEAMER